MLWLYLVGAIVVFVGLSVFFGAPYVPSHRKDIRRLFDDLTPISSDDVVLDLGSGDGVVLREVSRRGAKAVGFEIHPLFVGISKLLSLGDKNVFVRWVNGWITPFPDDTTLVYAFAVGRDGNRLKKTMQREVNRLERPLRLVCYGNALPGISYERLEGAYYLYIFTPLHLK